MLGQQTQIIFHLTPRYKNIFLSKPVNLRNGVFQLGNYAKMLYFLFSATHAVMCMFINCRLFSKRFIDTFGIFSQKVLVKFKPSDCLKLA